MRKREIEVKKPKQRDLRWRACARCGREFMPVYPGHIVCGTACPGDK